jgi:hypothetical protein
MQKILKCKEQTKQAKQNLAALDAKHLQRHATNVLRIVVGDRIAVHETVTYC